MGRVRFLLLSVLFLGTISVFAGNVFVNEDGIRASYISQDGNIGSSFNLTIVGADGQNYTLVYENGIVVNDPTNGSGGGSNESNSSFPSTGLISYYSFDTNANDDHGSNDGSVTGATLTTGDGGILDEAYDFDGDTDYVDLGSAVIPGSGNWTVNSWFKINGAATKLYPTLFSQYSGGQTGRVAMTIYHNTYNGPIFGIGSDQPIASNNNFVDNVWHMATAIKEGGRMYLYVDGDLITNATSSYDAYNGYNTRIGKLGSEDSLQDLKGYVDEVGFWSRALTSSEIEELYNNGDGLAYE